MRPLKGIFPPTNYPNLLVGLESPDDSAVYQLNETQAIISTMDFFPPVVDDAYDFGAIAAANALSDVYAMGGTPLMAINLAAYPDGLGMDLLSEILRGGAEKVMEAGAVIAGGHTVTDKEPKYGLAVTGMVHPAQIMTKGGAKPGDKLILTKPLGIGVVTTALKRQLLDDAHLKIATDTMKRLNKSASQLAREFGVRSMTDITGYGLMGHGREMSSASQVDFHIHIEQLKWLPGSVEHAQNDVFAGGMYRNKLYYEQWIEFMGDVPEHYQHLLFDPQTSGGLLMAVSADQAEALLERLLTAGDDAALIGEVVLGTGNIRCFA